MALELSEVAFRLLKRDKKDRTLQVRDVLNFLRYLTPPQLAESWDNVGLLVGDEDRAASSVMTCLTLTPDVAQEAEDRNASLIITHHPVLFRAVQRLTSETAEGAMLLSLIENGVSVFSPHTCYDSAQAGINRQLADSLGLQNIQPIRPIDNENSTTETSPVGSGRFGDLAESKSLAEVVELVKSALGVSDTQFVAANNSIHRIGIACGAAAEFMGDAAELGCDALLTGEARFHACLEARTLGISLIIPGHYATERPAMESLAQTISSEFSQLEVWASAVETDPLEWA